jgi:hypothetical protein
MTKLELCNLALARCGSEPIASLADDSKRAKAVVAQYPVTLLELLNDTPWSFATKRATISGVSGEPLYEYIGMYEQPADCIRVLSINGIPKFRKEGSKILCDSTEEIMLKYIYKNEDPSTWTASFLKCFQLKLAEDISYLLVQSASLQKTIADEADKYLRRARSYNAQEVGEPDSRYPDGYIAGARR